MKLCSRCHQKETKYKTSGYCSECHDAIIRLNDIIRLGPSHIKILWPYTGEEKLVYALKTGDYGCHGFVGCPQPTGPRSIPKKLIIQEPVGSPHQFIDTIFGAKYTVYFVLNLDTWFIKIGRTKQMLNERLLGLRQLHPRLDLLGALNGQGRPKEQTLHRRFKQDAVAGEWFRPSEALARFISEEC